MDQLFSDYLPVLIGTVIGAILIITALIGSRLLAPFSVERQKSETYECGMLPIRRASANVGMRFYLFAILFIIFAVEVVFIFPWAMTFTTIEPAGMAYWEMVVFIGILGAGLAYAWKKGALQWR